MQPKYNNKIYIFRTHFNLHLDDQMFMTHVLRVSDIDVNSNDDIVDNDGELIIITH